MQFWKDCTDSGKDFTKFNAECSFGVMDAVWGEWKRKFFL